MKKTKEQIVKEWCHNNGGASFNFETRDIILHDGGLFSAEIHKKRVKKFLRFMKIKSGKHKGFIEGVYSKKKTKIQTTIDAVFWFEELDETINYLRRMKRMLNKLGYDTGKSIRRYVK